MDDAVITDVEVPLVYATTMCLGRCVAFAEKLVRMVWDSCDGGRSITFRAANFVWQAPLSILVSMVFILEAVIVTDAQCSLCGLNTICVTLRIGCNLLLSSLVGSARGAAIYDVLIQIY